MEPTRALVHAVQFLQTAFTIFVALALGEALKAIFVDSDDRPVHWDRVPALLGFLVLVFPFFQGMSEHLYLHYLSASAPKAAVGFLMFDGIVFLIQAAIFFVLSRALNPRHWRRFYYVVLLLLAVDIGWSLITALRGINVAIWIYLDVALAAVMLLVLWLEPAKPASLRPSFIFLAAVCCTTAISYSTMSNVYFG